MTPFDSVLFDMDGTLWDAVESYAKVWNETIDDVCPGKVKYTTYSGLANMMGKPLDTIYATFIGDAADKDVFMEALMKNEEALMPRLGGALYPHVKTVVEKLHNAGIKLFMVSNCTQNGLPNFLAFTHLKKYFTDTLSFGQTGREKDYNIALMVRKHALQRPLYVGDTEGDCRSAHAAGVPFAWASYGFGRGVQDPEYTLESLNDLLKICSI